MTIVSERQPKGSGDYGYRVIGTRPIRHDGLDKVTGRARFGADTQVPGLLFGKFLRSPHAHARILSIDTTRAEAVPGVLAVATAADFPIVQAEPLEFSENLRTPRT